jgi:predicted PilT family ATPase
VADEVIMINGLPGAGKSIVSAALAEQMSASKRVIQVWTHLRETPIVFAIWAFAQPA